ncbi:MAG: carboxymethylenebutenolidase, partial [Erysipelotrichaceae bacterium]|nr:carboxymethylenebutenolidase [Erysipelotrichaceae bacterium]
MKIFRFIKKNWIKLSLGIILFLGLGFFWYISDYYLADNYALSILEKNDVYEVDNFIELRADSDIGFIFYPGGKVESLAYLVLLDSIRNEGINVYLVKMPFNLAVFNINAADKIIEKYPNIKQWYIGGHS